MSARISPDQDDIAASKPWLASYPPGVPALIDPDSAGTLVDIFDATVRRYPERPALESFGTRLTYQDVARHAAAIASWLQKEGVGRGDRVALMMPNVMAYPVAIIGALMAGATVVNVNPLYTPRELVFQLKDSGARTLFVLENFATTAEAASREVRLDRIVIVTPGDLLGLKGHLVNFVSRHLKKAVPPFLLPSAETFAGILKAGMERPFQPSEIGLGDTAFLQYTGGTTGVAKGAVLTHGNVAANVLQSEAWLLPTLGEHQHVMVTALPLYHIYALTCCCMTMVRMGGCQILVANPRDIPAFVKLLKTSRFTCMSGVNTLYGALVRAPGIRDVDFSSMVLSSAGGMATQSAVATAWKELTGHPIVEGYGLSETSPVVTTNRTDIADFTGTIGFPLPSTEVSIRDAEGRPVAAGEPGELCVRGPQVMAGYWQRPDETEKATTPDGFFRSGDIAALQPDGSLKIVDRMKDMILVSGFNVYPNEVEDVVASCPGVAEVAVIGLPDEHSGEQVAAYVAKADPGLSEAEVRTWCRERLTSYKVPRHIEFRDSLPKTNVGKVLRRALKEEAMKAQAARSAG